MRKPGRSGILKSVILSSVLGGILHQEIIAANTKTTSESIEKPGSKNMGGGAKIKLDTVLIDTLFGVKIFFRIGKRSVVNEFAKTTDVSLEGVTDSDSTIFLYSSPVDIQEFTLHRIIGNPEKAYLLQIQTIPASPPSGNGFLVIAPVRRELKVLFPGRLHFSGHFQKSTQGKSSDPEGVVSLDVWNGNFGIPFPLSVHSTEDSTYWNLGFIKPDTVLNAIVYKFPVAGLPEKNAFRKNENVTLYLDMSRKKKLKLKTSTNDEIEIQSVWVNVKSKRKRHSIQDILNSCEVRQNALLQVKMNGKEGFISYEDFSKIGYPEAG
jgi:hypothetical protein